MRELSPESVFRLAVRILSPAPVALNRGDLGLTREFDPVG